jgi:ATP-dependent RNA helicase DDX54/DBP10
MLRLIFNQFSMELRLSEKKFKSKDGRGFQSLDLSPPIYSGIKKLGYRTPTPVQRKSLPVLLTGNDAVGKARTGNGNFRGVLSAGA